MNGHLRRNTHYAAWTEGAQDSDVEAIRLAMAGAPERMPKSLPAIINAQAPEAARIIPPEAPKFLQ
jgi:hypothetical protein